MSGSSSDSTISLPLLIPEIPQIRDIDELKDTIDGVDPSSLLCICFIASWCEQCREITSRFHETMFSFNNVIFIIIDVDECGGLHEIFNITMVPAFVLIRNRSVLEIFVGNSYRRFLRRLQLQFEKDPIEQCELKRIAEILKDEVYMMDLTKLLSRYPNTIGKLGLRCAKRKLAWKSHAQNFIGAFEKLQQQGIINLNLDDIEDDEFESPSSSSSSSEETKRRRWTKASKILSKYLALEDKGSIHEERSQSSAQDLLDTVTDDLKEKCARNFDIQDRLYSSDEVKELLVQCLKKCEKETKEKKKEYKLVILSKIAKHLQPSQLDINAMLTSSSSDEETLVYSESLETNVGRLDLARDLKKKELTEKGFERESSEINNNERHSTFGRKVTRSTFH